MFASSFKKQKKEQMKPSKQKKENNKDQSGYQWKRKQKIEANQ